MEKKNDEYEAMEALHRKEWEKRQAEKKTAELAELDALRSLSNEDVISRSIRRVSEDTDRMIRRNMKECVSEYIQTLSLGDPDFARFTLHPRKTMRSCFRYIIKKAREYLETEGTLDTEEPLEAKGTGIRPAGRQAQALYGDVPDDLCYSWAEEYFRSSDIKEDQEQEDIYVPLPRPAVSRSGKKKMPSVDKAAGRSDADSTAEPSGRETGGIPRKTEGNVQLSLFDLETAVPDSGKLPA